MERIGIIIEEDNGMTLKRRGKYQIIYDKNKIKSYDDIKNYFKNFKLDEVYENELFEYGCESITYFVVLLKAEENIFLFRMKLDLTSLYRPTYETLFPSTEAQNEIREEVDQLIGKYPVILEYETIFYKNLRIEFEEGSDEFIEEDEEEIPPTKSSYHYDKCVICYDKKPNILNFPCLHISQCESCNEKGRFIKCVICKEEIQYKIII